MSKKLTKKQKVDWLLGELKKDKFVQFLMNDKDYRDGLFNIFDDYSLENYISLELKLSNPKSLKALNESKVNIVASIIKPNMDYFIKYLVISGITL